MEDNFDDFIRQGQSRTRNEKELAGLNDNTRSQQYNAATGIELSKSPVDRGSSHSTAHDQRETDVNGLEEPSDTAGRENREVAAQE